MTPSPTLARPFQSRSHRGRSCGRLGASVLKIRPLELLAGAFLIVVFVQVLPFGARTGIDAAALDAEVGGNPVRQLLYVAFFLAVAMLARRQALAHARSLPVALAALAGFAVLSLAWSGAPDVAARRLAATLLVGATMLIVGLALRPARTIAVLRGVTLLLAVATLLSGLLVPLLAIHQPGDPEPVIVGAWRGVFFHKNVAGGAIGLGLVLWAERWWAAPGRWRSLAAVLVVAVALVLTRSKSSQAAALLGIVALVGVKGMIRLARGDPGSGVLLRAGVAAAAATALVLVWSATDLGDYLLDPDAFTGRGALWQAVATLARERPLLGHGYASVFQVGDDGPLAPLATSNWVRTVSQSHNGLLDLWVTLGVIGVVLALWALFVDPWRRVARLPAPIRDEWQPLLAGIMAFAFVQGLMEGGLMVAGGVKWATLTLLVGVTVRLCVTTGARARRRGR